jgi:hypothetical protein
MLRGLLILAVASVVASCGQAPRPAVLDKEEVLGRQSFWDNRDFDWYAANVPFFESPEPLIDRTWWYRWEVVTKHLTYGSPETGYTFTEFIDRPFWSGTYGGISCPLGHQHYEVRWLKDRRIVEDFARYWFETPGAEPRSYSNWYADAMWATYLVTGDRDFLRTVFPHMEAQYAGWVEERWDAEHRMFRWDGMHDGMETNINSRLTVDEFSGAEGYRPTLNSYLVADARALSKAAALLGDDAKAADYAARAADLRQRILDELWDPGREFFFHQFARDEEGGIRAKSLTYETGPHAGSPYGREEIGFVPWQFHVPTGGYEGAWRFLADTARFAAPFGPTTVERNDPQFFVSPTCCVWSGNQWPYATTQTLAALANLLIDYEQDVVTKDDYLNLLRTYARLHDKDGSPYVAEAADPSTGSWEGHDTFYHSEHYFHSGFTDLVVTGLVGLRPREDDVISVHPLAPDAWDWFALDDVRYRGRTLSILWDRDGSRYGRGSGLSILVDGEPVASRPDLGPLEAPFEPGPPDRAERPANYAVNNDGSHFPFASASWSDPAAPPFWALDGSRWYHESPPNHWSTVGSPNAADWFEVDFGAARPLDRLVLYFMENRTLKPPARFDVHVRGDSGWVPVDGVRTPEVPTGRRANTVELGGSVTAAVRIVFEPSPGAAVGLTEVEAWGPDDPSLPEPATPAPNLALRARASASYTSPNDAAEQVNDGLIALSRYSRNRWTAWNSPSRSDWVMLEFDAPETVSAAELFLYDDGRGVRTPEAYRVDVRSDGGWVPVSETGRLPADPLGFAVNTVRFEPVTTDAVRITFDHPLPAWSGASEIRLWSDLPTN